jgi:molybdate transport system ATP-binding protein
MTIKAHFRVNRPDFDFNIDLVLPGSGVTAIFGPSGSGKTTFLRAIAGLDHHPEGFLQIGDEVWQDEGHFSPPHRRRIGYVFQETSLFPHLTVEQNLEYGLRRVPTGERLVRLDETVDLLGIDGLLERKPDRLSGGERQRVAIARALATSPRLLLMDEPLASLDESRKLEILPYLESLHRDLDIPVFYVSHDNGEVARLADHLVVLDQGKPTASGPVKEVLTRLDLPLAHHRGAEAVVDTVVAGREDAYNLTFLDFSGGRFVVPGTELSLGSRVRLRVAARDVSLTIEQQTGTSILNIIPTVIDEIAPREDARVTVRLLAGDTPLLARVTKKSADSLELVPGKRVFAQVKSVAVLA